MKNQEILDDLTKIFREFFDDEKINLNTESTADEIEDWDSLAQVGLIMSIEKKYSFKLNASEVGELENVGAMVNLIAEKI